MEQFKEGWYQFFFKGLIEFSRDSIRSWTFLFWETLGCWGGSFPLSCGVFLPLPLSQAFQLLVAGHMPPLLPEPLRPGLACLFTILGRISFPPSLALSTPYPLCYVSLLLITQFLFFPGWRSVCPGAMLFWPRVVCGSTTYHYAHLTLSTSSQAVWAQATGGPGAFLVSHISLL
jgi:hypothetical protein